MPVSKGEMKIFLEPILNAAFFQALEAVPAIPVDAFTTIVPSTKEGETYGWLGALSGMREFTDERNPQGLSTFDYYIKNKKWENTISVDRDLIDDDQYGQIKLKINGLAETVQRHKSKLVLELIKKIVETPTTVKAYDDIQVCIAARTVAGVSCRNLADTSYDDLTADNIQRGFVEMAKYVDDKGELLGVRPNILMVAQNLEFSADEIVNSVTGQIATAGNANTNLKNINVKNSLAGKLTIVVNPYFADNKWCLIDGTHAVKPIIFQERAAVEFAALEGNSEAGFMREEYYYGVRARYNVGVGLWQYIYAANP